jgi:hypothetical protein
MQYIYLLDMAEDAKCNKMCDKELIIITISIFDIYNIFSLHLNKHFTNIYNIQHLHLNKHFTNIYNIQH